MNKNVILALSLGAALVLSAASFWAGSYYQRTRFFAARQFGFPGGGQGRRFNFPGGGRPGMRMPDGGSRAGGGPRGERVMTGRLDKIDEDKLTLPTQFGSVKITLAKGAKIKSAKKAALDDLKVGHQLIIQSTMDSAGAMTAKSVILE